MTDRLVALVVMGVAGSGKSTVGQALASRLGWVFLEGDAFHTFSNVEKMSRGVPLTDSDRRPWLDALGREMAILAGSGKNAVVACSALRGAYRERLRAAVPGVGFVHLAGDENRLASRLAARKGHFADGRLLASQLDALEAPGPDEALLVDIEMPVAEIVEKICARLELPGR